MESTDKTKNLRLRLCLGILASATIFVNGCGEPPVKAVPITRPWSDMNLPIGSAIVWGSEPDQFKVLHRGALHEVAEKYVNYFEAEAWATTKRESSEHAYVYGFRKDDEQFEVTIYTFEDVGVIIRRRSQSPELAIRNKPVLQTPAAILPRQTTPKKIATPPRSTQASAPVPTRPLSADQSFLRNLTPAGSATLSGNDHKIDRSFTIQQVTFENGVYIHPPAPNSAGWVAYDLRRQFRKFSGRVGICDHYFRRSMTPLTFRILGDGVELWTSQPLQQCGDWIPFAVDVSNVDKLTLEVNCPGDHTGAHGGWMDPTVSRVTP